MNLVAKVVAQLRSLDTRDEQRRIVDALANASAEDLNALLTSIRVERLVAAIDHHREHLLELLARQRVAELTTLSLAAVLYALQVGYTGMAKQQAIREVLLSQRGLALTALKNQINMRVDQHDLEGLVFGNIGDRQIREDILAHCAQQAQGLNLGEAKTLCDIDDTIFSRIHDRRYPKGTRYPGALALLEALDQGPHDKPHSTGDLAFVTARPNDALGLIENHSRASLHQAGISNLSILTGSFFALLSKPRMAAKKLENIAHYAALFPEYELVFIGDSGQADVLVGQQMIADHADVVRAVLIHDVVDTPATTRNRFASIGVHFFDDYPQAAAIAHAEGLISEGGLAQVKREAEREGLSGEVR